MGICYCYCEACSVASGISSVGRSVGRSVRSYICADLLSIRKGRPQNGDSMEAMEPHLDPPLWGYKHPSIMNMVQVNGSASYAIVGGLQPSVAYNVSVSGVTTQTGPGELE